MKKLWKSSINLLTYLMTLKEPYKGKLSDCWKEINFMNQIRFRIFSYSKWNILVFSSCRFSPHSLIFISLFLLLITPGESFKTCHNNQNETHKQREKENETLQERVWERKGSYGVLQDLAARCKLSTSTSSRWIWSWRHWQRGGLGPSRDVLGTIEGEWEGNL